MMLYADSSGLVKRYLREADSDRARVWLEEAEQVVCCRIGFVEVYRAILLAGLDDPTGAARAFERDWEYVNVVEVHDALARQAAVLAASLRLRSLDALHLAAAQSVAGPDLRLMTWDVRLWHAARSLALSVLPLEVP
jgi:uncharacterized protein